MPVFSGLAPLLRCGEVAALFFGDGVAEAFEHQEHVFPDLAFFGQRLIAEKISGVISDHDGGAVVVEPATAEFAHWACVAKEAFDGGGAESDDDAGLDDFDLLSEPREAGAHFVELWLTIASRTGGHVRAALQDISDVDVIAREPHGIDDFRKELSGASDEGFALRVLIGSGGFADEHEFRIRIADTEDDVCAGRDEVRALCADESGLAEGIERRIAGALSRVGLPRGGGLRGFGRRRGRSGRAGFPRAPSELMDGGVRRGGGRENAVANFVELREDSAESGLEAIHQSQLTLGREWDEMKIGRNRSAKRHLLPGDGVAQRELPSVEEMPGESGATAIYGVASDGVAEMFEVDANLMRATGFWPAFDEAESPG
jgi:hypothetical protein